MSDAFKCDRCGELREGHPSYKTQKPMDLEGSSQSVEICEKCHAGLLDWWSKRSE